MSIYLSDHARKQIKKRKIPKRLVIEVVRNPDKKTRGFRNRVLRQKQAGDKIMEVVTVTEGPRITVITAYYLEGVSQ